MAHGLREGDGRPPPDHLSPHRAVQFGDLLPQRGLARPEHDPDGHTLHRDNYASITAEHNRTPLKPILDGEPGYENIPHAFNGVNPRLQAIHVRRFCYGALFSGACGHTYGCNNI